MHKTKTRLYMIVVQVNEDPMFKLVSVLHWLGVLFSFISLWIKRCSSPNTCTYTCMLPLSLCNQCCSETWKQVIKSEHCATQTVWRMTYLVWLYAYSILNKSISNMTLGLRTSASSTATHAHTKYLKALSRSFYYSGIVNLLNFS